MPALAFGLARIYNSTDALTKLSGSKYLKWLRALAPARQTHVDRKLHPTSYSHNVRPQQRMPSYAYRTSLKGVRESSLMDHGPAIIVAHLGFRQSCVMIS